MFQTGSATMPSRTATANAGNAANPAAAAAAAANSQAILAAAQSAVFFQQQQTSSKFAAVKIDLTSRLTVPQK